MKARVAGSLAFFFVGGARADTPPTFWDLGKNPDALEQYRRHVAIERDMEVEGVLSDDIMPLGVHARQAAIDDARDIIDSTPNKDVWLRFDEGWVAVKRDEPRRAIPILEAVAKELDRSWFADEVWQRLAEAYVKAERTTDEIHAYDEVLVRVTSDSERLTPLLNQGEALLRAGNAEGAVEQFRDVLRLSAIVPNGNTVGVLAQWDLALALDRAGDPRSAVEAARSAVRMDRRCIAVVDGDLKFMSVCRPDAAFYVVPPGLFAVSQGEQDRVLRARLRARLVPRARVRSHRARGAAPRARSTTTGAMPTCT